MSEKISDCWQTPDWLFKQLDDEFHFDIDLCAHKDNAKCNIYCTDYLTNRYNQLDGPFSEEDATKYGLQAYYRKNVSCFMNPPYSNPKPFIQKAWDDSKYCKIVCLVKCDPSTKWWAIFWNYEETIKIITVNESDFGIGTEQKEIKIKPGAKPGCEVRFLPKRIKFDPPQELIDSGEVWKICAKWVQRCVKCKTKGTLKRYWSDPHGTGYSGEYKCNICKGRGYKQLSGPTFSSALIVMDRGKV